MFNSPRKTHRKDPESGGGGQESPGTARGPSQRGTPCLRWFLLRLAVALFLLHRFHSSRKERVAPSPPAPHEHRPALSGNRKPAAAVQGRCARRRPGGEGGPRRAESGEGQEFPPRGQGARHLPAPPQVRLPQKHFGNSRPWSPSLRKNHPFVFRFKEKSVEWAEGML